MNAKILYFKFKKKNTEYRERNCKSKKNYANIFNNILNGEKNESLSEILVKNDCMENQIKITKKNKIKCISKVNNLSIQEAINSTKIVNKEENKNNEINIIKNNSNEIKNISKTENNINEKSKNNSNKNYINKSNAEGGKNLKIDLTKPYHLNKINFTKNATPCNISLSEEKNNILGFPINDKKGTKIRHKDSALKSKKNNNNIKKIPDHKKDSNIIKKEKNEKKNKQRTIVNNIDNYESSKIEHNSLIINKNEKKMSIKSKTNRFKKKEITKKGNKKLPSCEPKYFKSKYIKKIHPYNYVNKITITNDNIIEKTKLKNNINNINYTLNNDNKSKKLILNNTNSNINININITNINDKNINKKKSDFNQNNAITKLNADNNFNNNITTVNIINNSNDSKKKLNDYRLLFYNRPKKEKYLPYYNKINPKGIEIQSININLGEENDDDFNKIKIKKNFTENNKENNNNFHKKKEIENEKKEVQSEYEHFRDLDDFWSNRSQTSYSCKSGFTASRKLRSLSRERNKIKLLNNCQKKNEQDIERIGDKLLSIVNNFHNNSSIHNLKKNRKSLNGIRKRYKLSKNYNTISVGDGKNQKIKRKKY